jgi:glycosyltransferase involved in cell wall biosynthesis
VSAVVKPIAESRGAGTRVLVIRSCRLPQYVAAVAAVRQRYPAAEIVALSHRGHRESLLASGVDDVIEIDGRRFGPLRTPPAVLRRLRATRFDEVVVPQMGADLQEYANLHYVVALIGSPIVTVVPGDDPTLTFSRRAFRRVAALELIARPLAWLQSPLVFLLLSTVACLWPRRRSATANGRIRVLHIISSLGVGGAQRQLAELINRTPADRYDVDVLVLGRGDGEFSRQWITRRDVRVTYLTKWPRLVDSVLEIRRACRAESYDLVHTWLFMANVVGVAGARLAGVPRVVSSVRNLSLWKRTWYAQWWFQAADVLCARASDVVTVNAEALKSDHGSWALFPPSRITVVHNGLEPSQFLGDVHEARVRVREAAGVGEGTPVIGTVGRLAPEKDHRTFLRIVREVIDVRPDVRAVIVGDGQLRAELEAEAESLGLGDVVRFLGERSDARILMSGFDVFVLTSTIEGFPNVLLEAAFLGVPAVASRVGGSADVLPNPNDTFAAGDASAAARRVLRLIDEPALATALAHDTRCRAFSLFTADRTASRWFALYDRCVTEEKSL